MVLTNQKKPLIKFVSENSDPMQFAKAYGVVQSDTTPIVSVVVMKNEKVLGYGAARHDSLQQHAIMQALRRAAPTDGSQMYIYGMSEICCDECAGRLEDWGIETVYFIENAAMLFEKKK